MTARRLPLPRGAWRIAERLPVVAADPVVVSFVGPHELAAHLGSETVHCEPGRAYEWAWAVRRSVFVLVRPGIDATQCIRGLFRWSQLYPVLVDVQRQKAAAITAIEPRLQMWPMTKEVFTWKS